MADLAWGLQMMVVGMGVVFGLLLVLVGVLWVMGRLDRADAGVPDEPVVAPPADDEGPEVRVLADGLDDDQLAAVAVAVMTHAEVRRRSAAPEVRAAAPGSQLFASRWVAIGRSAQQATFRRR